MTTSLNQSTTYAGFGARFAAGFIDFLIWSPALALSWWGSNHWRVWGFYEPGFEIALGIFYNMYLVRKLSGTPGKRLMNLKIYRVDGNPIGYREAILRNLVDSILGAAYAVGMMIALSHMPETKYFSFSHLGRVNAISALAPAWVVPLSRLSNIWAWSELVVMLTNHKRRALHDFMAGTVVVLDSQPASQPLIEQVAH
jgi:uncharacterized RDD family membrane protein YckC